MRRSALPGVFLLSTALLAFQVALTRLASVTLSYHYTFLVLSIGLLGMGLGGALAVRFRAVPPATAATGFSLGGVATLGALLVAHRFAFPEIAMATMAAVPFTFAGLYLATVLRESPKSAPRIYGASLAGSALGCVVVFPLLGILGGEGTILSMCCLGGMAILCSAHRPLELAALVVPLLLLLAEQNTSGFPGVKVGPTSGKELAEARTNYTVSTIESRWSGYARTDLVNVAEFPHQKILYTDGAAPAPMLHTDGVEEFVEAFVGRVAFELVPKGGRALVLGSGGGRDVELALHMGASEVMAVEVNPDMVGLVAEYADFNGDVYGRPGVQLAVREGRSFVRRDTTQYDVILISLPRSGRSGNRAGYGLVESGLLTQEAMREFLEHLSPDGVLAYVAYGDADMLKLYGTHLSIHRGQGEQAAAQRVAIVHQVNDLGVKRMLFLAQHSPFTHAQRHQLAAGVRNGRIGLEFLAGVNTNTVISNLASQAWLPDVGLDTWIRRLGEIQDVDLQPATDDRPFFYKWERGVPDRLWALLAATGIPTLLLLVPVLVRRESDRSGLVYFALLGIAYIFVEVALVQRAGFFLGAPSHSLAVILGGLLIGGAVGSTFLSARLGPWTYRAPAVAVLAVGFTGLLAPVVFDAALGWSMMARIGVALTVSGLLGVALGVPFPAGLLRLAERNPESRVPWAWAANGMCAVVGSVGAMVCAVTWGYAVPLWIAAGLYGLASVVARRL